MFIPSLLLKQLYTFGSLENGSTGVRFALKNRLSDASFIGLLGVKIDGAAISLDVITLDFGNGTILKPDQVSTSQPVAFPLCQTVILKAAIPHLDEGKHQIEVTFQSKPFGKLSFCVDDAISVDDENRILIPRDPIDDYNPDIVKHRQKFVGDSAGMALEHLPKFSFDPAMVQGNIEHFTGVAQVPLGFAGPLQINGERAQGEFLIPLATTEGTLVASYNRGMKVLNLCGGVTCTVTGDAMQRAPVFVFNDARGARDFILWVEQNLDPIREQAEATSSVAKLLYIDFYQANKFAFLRFNFTTGDAAGQNMVGRATFAAC
ncbi:hydroxymethylglutaryl-CoA reductase, partial [Chloroflexota bacterium]